MWSQLFAFLASHLLYFALHLEKTSTFPKPLPSAEEQLCFEKMEQGDAKAREKLISHNLRLVAHIAKKYAGGQTDSDDLLSIGTIGLIKAVSSFSFRKGTRFATFAAKFCLPLSSFLWRNRKLPNLTICLVNQLRNRTLQYKFSFFHQ